MPSHAAFVRRAEQALKDPRALRSRPAHLLAQALAQPGLGWLRGEHPHARATRDLKEFHHRRERRAVGRNVVLSQAGRIEPPQLARRPAPVHGIHDHHELGTTRCDPGQIVLRHSACVENGNAEPATKPCGYGRPESVVAAVRVAHAKDDDPVGADAGELSAEPFAHGPPVFVALFHSRPRSRARPHAIRSPTRIIPERLAALQQRRERTAALDGLPRSRGGRIMAASVARRGSRSPRT